MKRIVVLISAILLTGLLATLVHARANPQNGKEIFREKCKTCHVSGGEGGAVAPSSKTQRQWRRFFKRDQHRDRPEVWESLTKEEREDLWRFFYESALDANRPETCG